MLYYLAVGGGGDGSSDFPPTFYIMISLVGWLEE